MILFHDDRLGLSTVSISSTTGIERQRADAKELISGWLRNMPGERCYFHNLEKVAQTLFLWNCRYVYRPNRTEG